MRSLAQFHVYPLVVILFGVVPRLPSTVSFTFHHALSPTSHDYSSHGLFSPPSTASSSTRLYLSSSGSSGSDEEEKSNQMMSEEDRMEMVRKLQKTFYTATAIDAKSDAEMLAEEQVAAAELDVSTGIFKNLPLWRVGWVECPGRANCLNVHEGHYTNMFETILAGPKPWYFGHLHLPGGTKSARSKQRKFDLKSWRQEMEDDTRWDDDNNNASEIKGRSAIIGCLMRISDYRRLEDGRLILLVHALERFVVDRPIQSFPFAKADVQILPDMDLYNVPTSDGKSSSTSEGEAIYKVARAKAIQEAFRFHEYEFSQTKLLPLPKDKDYLETTATFGSAIVQVLPFAFYADNDSCLQDIKISDGKDSDMTTESLSGDDNSNNNQRPLEQTLIYNSILQYPLSLAIDNSDASTDCNVLETLLWIELDEFCTIQSFRLPKEILQLMPPHLTNLDMDPPKERLSPKYPAKRRQHRFSYHLPHIIEQVPYYGANMRQTWLNTPTTAARLRALLERFQAMNGKVVDAVGEFE